MNDTELQAIVEAALESELADDASAADARSVRCVSMRRLAGLAAGLRATDDERRHIGGCGLCAGRLAAFGRRSALGDGIRPAARRRLRSVWRAAAVVAAAAAVILSVRLPHDAATTPPEKPCAHPAERAGVDMLPITVCRDDPETAGESPAARFVTTTGAPCIALVAYRDCDPGCECHQWTFHPWTSEGQVFAALRPDEWLEVLLQVGSERVGQFLVLASVERSGTWPLAASDTGSLIDCLNEFAPSPCDHADPNDFTNAYGCLPADVTIVAQTFSMR